MSDWDDDDFDIDSYLANEEKREEIAKLHQLARDCNDEQQYAKAEKFYQRAAELAEELNNLSLMIEERFGLAIMQTMQGKDKAALGTFTWLMEVAYSPDLSRDLTEDDLWCVAGGFMCFVDVGRYLPDMAAADLHRVIDRGLDWLSSIGKRDWTSGLRFQRGMLWQSQGRKEAALEELEAALALCRRYPDAPGATVSSHVLKVADLLREMGKLEEAENYYREVAESYEFDSYDQRWAWKGLAQVALQRQDWTNAESYALKSLELARGIESPNPMMLAYNVLGDVYWQQKQVEPAISAKIQAWHYARQMKIEEDLYELYRDFAEIRIYQATHDTTNGNSQRYLPKAQQWLSRALPLAICLDRQVNSTECQTEIQNLQGEYLALLQGEST
ncbi:MAG: tetratricopeptide repeat protein [Pseudanabaenaceae cyanobacterium bins.39]|nr:tetratricopeptide repeat protein [Pseudanabaenaceae cyanobacterium bins.39]